MTAAALHPKSYVVAVECATLLNMLLRYGHVPDMHKLQIQGTLTRAFHAFPVLLEAEYEEACRDALQRRADGGEGLPI